MTGVKRRLDRIKVAIVLAGLLAPALIAAQEAGGLPEIKAPAAAQAQPPATSPLAQPAPGAQQLSPSGHPINAYWSQHDQLMLTDFAWLAHFRDDDAKLGPPAPAENRVVFMGDSITEGWRLDQSFPGKRYFNRGISGQTTPQMVLRFHQDVINLQPKAVVILAGINDLAGNTGPESIEDIENNLAAMAEIASANRVKVVLCSVLPAYDFPWNPGQYPIHKIVELNTWIEHHADEHGYVYVDYYSHMKDDRGGLPPTLSRDGVHPLPAGFAIMTPLAEAGIEKALKKGN